MKSPLVSSRSARSLAIAFALVATLAYCSDSGLAKIPQQWQLSTVAGHALPDTLSGTEPEIVITAGSSQIFQNGTYTVTFTGSTGGTAGTVGTDNGTWSISSSTFVFRSGPLGGNTYIAALGATEYNVDLPGQLVHASTPIVSMHFTVAP